MKESRRVKITKRLMKDALLELMSKKPISKISVTAICAAADVNRSTFYAYYNEPVELLNDAENDIFEKMPVIPDMTNAPDDKEFLRVNIEFFDYIKQNVNAFKVLLVDTDSVSFQNRLIEKLQEMYKWQDKRKDEHFNHYRYIYISNGAVGMLKEWIKQDFAISSKDFAKLLMDVVLYR